MIRSNGFRFTKVVKAVGFQGTFDTRNTESGSSASNQLTLPFNYVPVEAVINWGDGDTDTVVASGNITHTYSSDGIYNVSITGEFGLAYGNIASRDKLKIISVESWGGFTFQGGSQAHFSGCSNFVGGTYTDIPAIIAVDLNNCFRSSDFNSSVEGWNVTTATRMQETFRFSPFDQDTSSWDVSNCTRFDLMFGSTPYNSPVFDIQSAGKSVNINRMFTSATLFNQDISTWDTSGVTNMFQLFRFAFAFNQDLSGFNISSLTNAFGMLDATAMSTANYDALLIGWEAGPRNNNVSLGASGLTYTLGGAAEAARTALINDGWTITGDSGV